MKKNHKIVPLLLTGLVMGLLPGCSSMTTGEGYALDGGSTFGNYIIRATTSLSQGNIVAATLEETYSPCLWARVNPDEFTDSVIPTIDVDGVTLLDGTTGTVHFAKYIQIGDLTLTGSLRDSENADDSSYMDVGEYIDYRIDSIPDGGSTPSDLVKYMAVTDAGTDKTGTYKLGSRYNWYFNAVKTGAIYAWGSKKSSLPQGIKREDSVSSASSSETETIVRDKAYSLTFPDGNYLRNDSTAFASWSAAAESLTAFMVQLKQLNYVYSTTDADNNVKKCIKVDSADKTYLYNTGYAQGVFSDDNWLRIEGCKSTDVSLNSIKAYFDILNRCYASVEYDSKK